MTRDWKIGYQFALGSASEIELLHVTHRGTDVAIVGRIAWSTDPQIQGSLSDVTSVAFDGKPVKVDVTVDPGWQGDPPTSRDFVLVTELVNTQTTAIEVRIGASSVTAPLG